MATAVTAIRAPQRISMMPRLRLVSLTRALDFTAVFPCDVAYPLGMPDSDATRLREAVMGVARAARLHRPTTG